MNKPLLLTLLSISIILSLFVFIKIYNIRTPLGISSTENSFGSPVVTNASTTCGAAVSILLTATDTARTSFGVSLDGANTTYLCRGATCRVISGITLNTNCPVFIQIDAYTGGYSCIANASSTVTHWKSN